MTDRLAKTACELLADRTAFVIATIVSHQGSTPRTSGTQMIIRPDGGITGTIGGGLLEARVMARAVEILSGQRDATFMPFDLTEDDVASMDMICGGHAEIFLDHVRPTPENAEIFGEWAGIRSRRETGWFVTAVTGGPERIASVRRGVVTARDPQATGCWLPADISEKIAAGGAPSLITLSAGDTRFIVEPATRPKTVFLFGAGHVAQPTAHLCALTGFHVIVLDDRDTFANPARFPDAREIHVLDSFENAFPGLHADADSFIVIFTRGHLHDRVVLAQALKTSARYIGMIGSRRKRDAIYKALKVIGYSQTDIDRVHSPIGLPIGAQTPEEIAVSIVAEMIQERARM